MLNAQRATLNAQRTACNRFSSPRGTLRAQGTNRRQDASEVLDAVERPDVATRFPLPAEVLVRKLLVPERSRTKTGDIEDG